MSRDGFYAVHFQTPNGMGSGVVTLVSGHIRGGDSLLYYMGNYKLDGDNFSGEVTTNSHSEISGMTSVFGRNNVHIALAGKFNGKDATLTGSAQEVPGVPFSASLRWLGP